MQIGSRTFDICALPQTSNMTHVGFQHTFCVEKQKTHENDARAHFNQQKKKHLFIETSKFHAIVEIAFEIYRTERILIENCVAIVRMANYSDILTEASIVTLVLAYFQSVYRSIFILNGYFYEYQLLKVSE